jgi:flagellar motility protein MotE (MotC chaperone)
MAPAGVAIPPAPAQAAPAQAIPAQAIPAQAVPATYAPQGELQVPPPATQVAIGAPDNENALQYCSSIVNAAADARFARQKDALAAMEKQIQERIAQLEAKRTEYQDWLVRREAFLKKADETLVQVMSQMRPDAAAAQLSAMSEDAAAAVLAKVSPRVASAILNEMEPARAARLTTTMVGISRRTLDGRAS